MAGIRSTNWSLQKWDPDGARAVAGRIAPLVPHTVASIGAQRPDAAVATLRVTAPLALEYLLQQSANSAARPAADASAKPQQPRHIPPAPPAPQPAPPAPPPSLYTAPPIVYIPPMLKPQRAGQMGKAAAVARDERVAHLLAVCDPEAAAADDALGSTFASRYADTSRPVPRPPPSRPSAPLSAPARLMPTPHALPSIPRSFFACRSCGVVQTAPRTRADVFEQRLCVNRLCLFPAPLWARAWTTGTIVEYFMPLVGGALSLAQAAQALASLAKARPGSANGDSEASRGTVALAALRVAMRLPPPSEIAPDAFHAAWLARESKTAAKGRLEAATAAEMPDIDGGVGAGDAGDGAAHPKTPPPREPAGEVDDCTRIRGGPTVEGVRAVVADAPHAVAAGRDGRHRVVLEIDCSDGTTLRPYRSGVQAAPPDAYVAAAWGTVPLGVILRCILQHAASQSGHSAAPPPTAKESDIIFDEGGAVDDAMPAQQAAAAVLSSTSYFLGPLAHPWASMLDAARDDVAVGANPDALQAAVRGAVAGLRDDDAVAAKMATTLVLLIDRAVAVFSDASAVRAVEAAAAAGKAIDIQWEDEVDASFLDPADGIVVKQAPPCLHPLLYDHFIARCIESDDSDRLSSAIAQGWVPQLAHLRLAARKGTVRSLYCMLVVAASSMHRRPEQETAPGVASHAPHSMETRRRARNPNTFTHSNGPPVASPPHGALVPPAAPAAAPAGGALATSATPATSGAAPSSAAPFQSAAEARGGGISASDVSDSAVLATVRRFEGGLPAEAAPDVLALLLRDASIFGHLRCCRLLLAAGAQPTADGVLLAQPKVLSVFFRARAPLCPPAFSNAIDVAMCVRAFIHASASGSMASSGASSSTAVVGGKLPSQWRLQQIAFGRQGEGEEGVGGDSEADEDARLELAAELGAHKALLDRMAISSTGDVTCFDGRVDAFSCFMAAHEADVSPSAAHTFPLILGRARERMALLAASGSAGASLAAAHSDASVGCVAAEVPTAGGSRTPPQGVPSFHPSRSLWRLPGHVVSTPRRTVLDLSPKMHTVGSYGAAALSPSLTLLGPLRVLALDHCALGDAGARALAAHIGAVPSLEVLTLSGNGMTSGGARALFETLPSTRIGSVCLADNHLSAVVMEPIGAHVPRSRLHTLSLAGAPLGPQAMRPLAECLVRSPQLLHLDVSGCGIGASGFAALISRLPSTSIVSLAVRANAIDDVALQALTAAVASSDVTEARDADASSVAWALTCARLLVAQSAPDAPPSSSASRRHTVATLGEDASHRSLPPSRGGDRLGPPVSHAALLGPSPKPSSQGVDLDASDGDGRGDDDDAQQQAPHHDHAPKLDGSRHVQGDTQVGRDARSPSSASHLPPLAGGRPSRSVSRAQTPQPPGDATSTGRTSPHQPLHASLTLTSGDGHPRGGTVHASLTTSNMLHADVSHSVPGASRHDPKNALRGQSQRGPLGSVGDGSRPPWLPATLPLRLLRPVGSKIRLRSLDASCNAITSRGVADVINHSQLGCILRRLDVGHTPAQGAGASDANVGLLLDVLHLGALRRACERVAASSAASQMPFGDDDFPSPAALMAPIEAAVMARPVVPSRGGDQQRGTDRQRHLPPGHSDASESMVMMAPSVEGGADAVRNDAPPPEGTLALLAEGGGVVDSSFISAVLGHITQWVGSVELPRARLTAIAVPPLLESLALCCRLHTLCLADANITSAHCAQLASVVRSLPALRALDVSYNALGGEGGAVVVAALMLPGIKELRCAQTAVGDTTFASLMDASVAHAPDVSKAPGADGMGGVACLPSRIEVLDLRSCALTVAAVRTLAAMARGGGLSNLRQLFLSRNMLGVVGAQVLVQSVLKALPRALDIVDIGHVECDGSVAKALAGTLLSPRALDLAGIRGARGCVGAVSSLLHLQAVCLSHARLTAAELQPLVQAALSRPVLATLDLSNNWLDNAACAVLRPLLTAGTLRSLNLSRNALGPSVATLGPALRSAACVLERLDVSFCGAGEGLVRLLIPPSYSGTAGATMCDLLDDERSPCVEANKAAAPIPLLAADGEGDVSLPQMDPSSQAAPHPKPRLTSLCIGGNASPLVSDTSTEEGAAHANEAAALVGAPVPPWVAVVVDLASQWPCLQHLSLACTPVGLAGALHIVDVDVLARVPAVDLTGCGLGDDAAAVLLAGVQKLIMTRNLRRYVPPAPPLGGGAAVPLSTTGAGLPWIALGYDLSPASSTHAGAAGASSQADMATSRAASVGPSRLAPPTPSKLRQVEGAVDRAVRPPSDMPSDTMPSRERYAARAPSAPFPPSSPLRPTTVGSIIAKDSSRAPSRLGHAGSTSSLESAAASALQQLANVPSPLAAGDDAFSQVAVAPGGAAASERPQPLRLVLTLNRNSIRSELVAALADALHASGGRLFAEGVGGSLGDGNALAAMQGLDSAVRGVKAGAEDIDAANKCLAAAVGVPLGTLVASHLDSLTPQGFARHVRSIARATRSKFVGGRQIDPSGRQRPL